MARTRPSQPVKSCAEHASSVHRKCGNEVEQTEDEVHEHQTRKKCSQRRVRLHPTNSQQFQTQQTGDDREVHGRSGQGDQQLRPGRPGHSLQPGHPTNRVERDIKGFDPEPSSHQGVSQFVQYHAAKQGNDEEGR